ncbi:MAG: Mov34/MPN/PAD-1 family protein [Promethearchaeota archaeon]
MHNREEVIGNTKMTEDLEEENGQFITVWILDRVKEEIYNYCKQAMPNEAIGVILGHRMSYKGRKYVKVVDWTSGEAEAGRTFAKFTSEGVRQYYTFLDERYGFDDGFKDGKDYRPRLVGIFHSHPFGVDPSFSATDYQTFLNFPYNAEHNVFILIDPQIDAFKVFQVRKEKQSKALVQVIWGEYAIS